MFDINNLSIKELTILIDKAQIRLNELKALKQKIDEYYSNKHKKE